MAKREFIWAVDENNMPCKCYAKPENRGKGKCNHIAHAEIGQSKMDFYKQYSMNNKEIKKMMTKKNELDSINQDEINNYAKQLDIICGQKVTEDNYEEVLEKLTPEQLDQLNKLGFEAAPNFSLPVTDEMFDEVNISNRIYFAELPDYHIGGKETAVCDMFGSIGPVPVQDGKFYDIQENFRDGLSAKEYYLKTIGARASLVQKAKSVSNPGEAARQLFYGLSKIEVIEDCGAEHSKGIMDCKAPGICKKCAAKSGFKVKTGDTPGAIISQNATEGLYQSTLNAIHQSVKNSDEKPAWRIVRDGLLGWGTSDFIKEAATKKTTKERRETIFKGLKKAYKDADLKIDDYNLEIIAKEMTSYKNINGELVYAKEDECADISGIKKIGNSDNIAVQCMIQNSYNNLTKPQKFKIENTAATKLL